MRNLAILALAAASVSAADVTTVNGITLTNGVSTLTDTSAIVSGPNKSTGIGYLTDANTATSIINLGYAGGSLKGTFASSLSSSATGIYLIGAASGGSAQYATLMNGSMSVQLDLVSGAATSKRYLSDANFTVINQQVATPPFYQNINGNLYTLSGGFEKFYYTYAYIPFSAFGTSYDKVAGVRLGDFTELYADLSYIGGGFGLTGAGYSNTAPVPEASTYGLMLGGLALAGAVIRRRKISK